MWDKMIKAIFFDIDGTLMTFSDHTMPKSTQNALKALRERGVKLFVATGRHKSMLALLEDYFDFDGYITVNGQYCVAGDDVVRMHEIDQNEIARIIEKLNPEKHSLDFLTDEGRYSTKITPMVKGFCEEAGIPLPTLSSFDDIKNHPVIQMNIFMPREDEEAFFASLSGVRIVRWHPDYFDVIPIEGGKDCGIKAFMDYYGFSQEETMAFGDGENDIDMLEFAGIGVAMGNAGDVTKEAADYVTDTVENDGIAKALTHFGLL